jgi:mercuric ion binding protein
MNTLNSFFGSFLALVFFLGISTGGFSQDSKQEINKDSAQVQIKTSAICGMCKNKIEHDLALEKGIKSVSLDLDTKVVTVGYNPKKTDPDQIRKAISLIGYDADKVPADKKAYDKLPGCCKK